VSERTGAAPTIRRLAGSTARRLGLWAPILMYTRGLRDCGWIRSARTGLPVDGGGAPVPWYTYAATAFLDERLTRDLRVFEYGAGNSTRWYEARVDTVVAVEHRPAWADRVSAGLEGRAKLVLEPDAGAYVDEIHRHDGAFDLVAVDGWGRLRQECGEVALTSLSPAGVVVWDNSDEDSFRAATRHPGFGEFHELRFHGFGPIVPWMWTTSILYRPGNCLGI
jgi:hypothetical protein